MTFEELYKGAKNLINQLLIEEFRAQGHSLTGRTEESFDGIITDERGEAVMEGIMVDYAKYVKDGFGPESATMKQFPFLVEYFQKRGYETKEAKRFAAATIKKWQQEGMSTQASKRFSKTGARQGFVESAFVGNEFKIDDYMSKSYDFMINEDYLKEKSETI